MLTRFELRPMAATPRTAFPVVLRWLGIAACIGLSGCATVATERSALPARGGLEIVNATLYQQTAAEYRALTRQVYDQAIARLDPLLADLTISAAPEQQPPFADKPPAVIVDVDETILDNAPYEARLVQSGQPFQQSDWNAWVAEAAAPAIPGALDFARACADRGIVVIYLSNRRTEEAEITRRNLERLGFPAVDSTAHFWFRPEDRADPLSSKGARRARVAERFRILMLVGDNLGDFTEDFRSPVAERQAVVDRERGRFGQTWFMLPNAMYGSWEDSLLEFNRALDDSTRHARKKAWLDPEGLGPLDPPAANP